MTVAIRSHAAARWGHVMYPEAAHAPALELADRLLQGPGRGWAQRVFYSDDGSTAVEIGLKMALRSYSVKKVRCYCDPASMQPSPVPPLHAQGLLPHPPPLRVLALNGSYHGDTLGAANAQAPSVFTGPTQAPWYTPRGVFLDPPTVELAADGWRVVLPPGLSAPNVAVAVPSEALRFTKDALFSAERDKTALCEAYRALASAALADAALHADGAVGAAIIEPVMHGAGGMVFIDPAFQRAVAAVCRAQQVPLIADEVFSGLWRFGAVSASQLLGVEPDVACYAKLLTGGTVPLAATLASEDVFDAFRGAEKTDALLHGHSFSAHAIGCAAACSALDIFADAVKNLNLLPGAGVFTRPRVRGLLCARSKAASLQGACKSCGTLLWWSRCALLQA
jgi:dethiobiotin synthetase/adenosylmethionine--8-amino-7-oxononanoate aminotransferase